MPRHVVVTSEALEGKIWNQQHRPERYFSQTVPKHEKQRKFICQNAEKKNSLYQVATQDKA